MEQYERERYLGTREKVCVRCSPEIARSPGQLLPPPSREILLKDEAMFSKLKWISLEFMLSSCPWQIQNNTLKNLIELDFIMVATI